MEERDRIAHLTDRGFCQKEIAQQLGRSPSTICRELARNGAGPEYYAAQAHETAQRRREERPIARRIDDPSLNETVRHGLARRWSPEQIAGRMKREHPDDARQRVSAQTIYYWIEHDEHRDHWKAFLRQRGKRRRRRENAEKRADCARVHDRCEEIEQRLRLGDWEGDTVLGPVGTGGLVTLVDRKSRYTIICKIQTKDANHVHARIKQRLKELQKNNAVPSPLITALSLRGVTD
jgi:IS30 family transposase